MSAEAQISSTGQKHARHEEVRHERALRVVAYLSMVLLLEARLRVDSLSGFIRQQHTLSARKLL